MPVTAAMIAAQSVKSPFHDAAAAVVFIARHAGDLNVFSPPSVFHRVKRPSNADR